VGCLDLIGLIINSTHHRLESDGNLNPEKVVLQLVNYPSHRIVRSVKRGNKRCEKRMRLREPVGLPLKLQSNGGSRPRKHAKLKKLVLLGRNELREKSKNDWRSKNFSGKRLNGKL
jgi:hypothetical protein